MLRAIIFADPGSAKHAADRLFRGTVLLAVATLAAMGLRRRVHHVVVEGASMAPTLRPGDRLLLVRRGRRPRPGRLALAADPRVPRRTLLKRAHTVADGWVELRGDNAAASTDTRTFGVLPVSAVRGCVAWRYFPTDRAGRVR